MGRATSIPETVTLHVPFRLEKQRRKEMQLPAVGLLQHKTDKTLVKGLPVPPDEADAGVG